METARRIIVSRHPQAIAAYWAGSLLRGEGTPTSDIDLVIIYDELTNAWRNSFIDDGRVCETFVHDPRSLESFLHRTSSAGDLR